MKKNVHLLMVLVALLYSVATWTTVSNAADAENLDEGAIQAYLEKKAVADPGSCLVEDTKVEILGIADVVPGHQTEVFYKYEYLLRCNRGSDTKSGQGVLKAVRLRDGRWVDRETLSAIAKH